MITPYYFRTITITADYKIPIAITITLKNVIITITYYYYPSPDIHTCTLHSLLVICLQSTCIMYTVHMIIISMIMYIRMYPILCWFIPLPILQIP